MEPVAWAFYHPDGRLRFIVEGRERAEAWRTAHEGEVVPLYAETDVNQAIEQARGG